MKLSIQVYIQSIRSLYIDTHNRYTRSRMCVYVLGMCVYVLGMCVYVLGMCVYVLGRYETGWWANSQARSVCLTCTFRASCCSARLSRAQVQAFAGSSVRDREKKGEGVRGGGGRLHWRVQGSTSSPTGIGSRRRVV